MAAGVRILADSVIKQYGPSHFDQEVAKARRLQACGASNGFVSPRILATDPDSCSITYEKIDGLTSVREYYRDLLRGRRPERAERVLAEVGRLLAVLHEEMVLADTIPWSPPESYRPLAATLASTPQVLLHGDFGFSNVFTAATGSTRIVGTLDASPNGFSTFAPHETGSIYLDVGHFLSCLNGLIPLRGYLGANWDRLPEIVETFIDGYENRSGQEIDRDLAARVGVACASSYFEKRFGRGLRSRWAMALLYNDRKGNRP